jgi:putative FmdB family regulatory protein
MKIPALTNDDRRTEMPIYEYICAKCNFEFQLRLPLSESDKAVTCPQCNAKAQKLFSSFGCKTGGNLQASKKPFRKPADG